MANSVRPHRRQPTRLRRPWDSPGKNTGVGCHFLLQCMKEKSESEVTQSFPTLSNHMDCSLPGPSVHGIFQARVLEWGAISFSGDLCLGSDQAEIKVLTRAAFSPGAWSPLPKVCVSVTGRVYFLSGCRIKLPIVLLAVSQGPLSPS